METFYKEVEKLRDHAIQVRIVGTKLGPSQWVLGTILSLVVGGSCGVRVCSND